MSEPSKLSDEEIKQEMSKAINEAHPMILSFVAGKLANIIKDKVRESDNV